MAWTPKDSLELYNVLNWGHHFFNINDSGHITIDPRKDGNLIDLKELVDDAQSKGLALPLLIRFSDILEARIQKIYHCFENAIAEFNYQGQYYGVYPIKVNPQQQVVEEIVRFGAPYRFGLEAGSKPELHAVLAMMDHPNALIICNGYKDESYIRLALLAQKLERRVFLVVEKLHELEIIIRVARELGIRPMIGLRIKLTTEGSGFWSTSGGEFSKFGLAPSEVVRAVELAASADMLSCIELLHFHIGSQITNIRNIKEALKEIGRFYSELYRMGCSIGYIDVGGGLGVDYDGTRSTSASSVNYSIQEYANDIVYHLYEICEQENLPHPHLISESGRALTAHHSVMVLNVFATSAAETWDFSEEIGEEYDITTQNLYEILSALESDNCIEHWHDALELKEQVLDKFSLGLVPLSERAKAEKIFWSIAHKVNHFVQSMEHIPQELHLLSERIASQYFCNFSVFQSIPDSWAINQVFPMMPIHRLEEEPTLTTTLHDVTCDSDGKVGQFIQYRKVESVLPVHASNDQPYLIGIFLVGAYQEILGDMHNLFGDTNAVHVALNDNGGWRYEQIIKGDKITDVLDYVQFKDEDLLERISRLVGISMGKGLMQTHEAKEFMEYYRTGLYEYTYPNH